MATELRTRVAVAAAAVAVAASVTPLHAAASAWWAPLAFAGQRVDSVSVAAGRLTVTVGADTYVSTNAGLTFTVAAAHAPSSSAPPAAAVDSGGRVWAIRNGTVVTGTSAASAAPDPAAPDLGPTAHLIAAPAALPGVVVAVGTDGHVWRRGGDGRWSTAFILLPAGGVSGAPPITGLQAFTTPLSDAVYLGTDGYGVLLSSNGGDDWIRADPGLPDNVLALATDPAAKALYAATDNGLWVHTLQVFPSPPVYHDADLWLRWLGIVAVALVATLCAVLGLRALLPNPRPDA